MIEWLRADRAVNDIIDAKHRLARALDAIEADPQTKSKGQRLADDLRNIVTEIEQAEFAYQVEIRELEAWANPIQVTNYRAMRQAE